MLEQAPFCTLLTRGFSRKHNKICSWQYGHPSDTECLFVLATSAMEENWPSSACLICPPTSALSHANNFATVSPAVVPALPLWCGVASSRLASLCDAPFQSSCGHVLPPPLCPHTTTPLMFVRTRVRIGKRRVFFQSQSVGALTLACLPTPHTTDVPRRRPPRLTAGALERNRVLRGDFRR